MAVEFRRSGPALPLLVALREFTAYRSWPTACNFLPEVWLKRDFKLGPVLSYLGRNSDFAKNPLRKYCG